jgi:hypothetical protein
MDRSIILLVRKLSVLNLLPAKVRLPLLSWAMTKLKTTLSTELFLGILNMIISWLGRRDLFQTFDEDLKCDVVEIRTLLDEPNDTEAED